MPAKMKRAWAAMLTVLNEIDLICKRHGLKWWADWGTLIGVIRHRGFIPWDDDIDISMMRDDYMTFIEVANRELPEGYYCYSIYTDDTYRGYTARVANSRSMRGDEAFLNANSGLPYMSGVDIMCIDYMSPDGDYLTEQKRIISELDMLAGGIDETLRYEEIPELHKTLYDIEKVFDMEISHEIPVAVQLYRLCEKLMSSVKRDVALSSTCMGMYAIRDKFRAVFPKEYYEELITAPCEFMEVPVPLHYDDMLHKIFGNYMKPYRAGGIHDYPCYCRQEALLRETVGKVMWDTCSFDGLSD
ncbi:MAG: LicD family protein [Lachnospiraceae bacterium]|nr:LicD family protein [Lachnospiraceae bacterium]